MKLILLIKNIFIYIMNDWYNSLNKSPYTPPGYVISIIWTILYTMIFMAFITNNNYCLYCNTTYFFILQLFFNIIWSPIFFNLQKPTLALVDIILIIIFTLLYMLYSNTTSRLLLIPYIVWLFIAFYFNLYIVLNN